MSSPELLDFKSCFWSLSSLRTVIFVVFSRQMMSLLPSQDVRVSKYVSIFRICDLVTDVVLLETITTATKRWSYLL